MKHLYLEAHLANRLVFVFGMPVPYTVEAGIYPAHFMGLPRSIAHAHSIVPCTMNHE
jgi:hypothetical protein